jgi:hypothetical protein
MVEKLEGIEADLPHCHEAGSAASLLAFHFANAFDQR